MRSSRPASLESCFPGRTPRSTRRARRRSAMARWRPAVLPTPAPPRRARRRSYRKMPRYDARAELMFAAISSIGASKKFGMLISFAGFRSAFGPVILAVALLTCRPERPAATALTVKASTLSHCAHRVANASFREMPCGPIVRRGTPRMAFDISTSPSGNKSRQLNVQNAPDEWRRTAVVPAGKSPKLRSNSTRLRRIMIAAPRNCVRARPA